MRVRHQISITFLTEGFNLVCNFAFGVLVARALEAAGRGDVAAAWTTLTISVSVCGLGVAKALVSLLNERDGRIGVGGFYAGAALLLPLQIVLAGMLTIAFFPKLPDDFYWAALIICLAAAPVALLTETARGVHRAQRRISVINLSTAAPAALRVVGIAFLWWLDTVSVASVLALELAALALAGAVATFCLRWDEWREAEWAKAGAAAWSLARYGLIFQLYSITFGLISRSGMLATHSVSGAEATGQFAIAARLAEYMGTFSNNILLVIMPLIAQSATDKLKIQTTALMCRMSVLLLAPAAAALCLIGPFIIPFVYGPSFSGAVDPFNVMLLAMLCATLFQFTGAMAIATGNMTSLITIVFIGLALCWITLAITLRPMEATGAALGSLAGYSFALLANSTALKVSGRVKLSDLFVPRLEDFKLILERRRRTDNPK